MVAIIGGPVDGVAIAQANNVNSVREGAETVGGSTSNSEQEVNNLITKIINIFSWVVGVTSVIMIIYGGFAFVTSAGNSEKAARARSIILYALIGIVIVVVAQVLVRFVISFFS